MKKTSKIVGIAFAIMSISILVAGVSFIFFNPTSIAYRDAYEEVNKANPSVGYYIFKKHSIMDNEDGSISVEFRRAYYVDGNYIRTDYVTRKVDKNNNGVNVGVISLILTSACIVVIFYGGIAYKLTTTKNNAVSMKRVNESTKESNNESRDTISKVEDLSRSDPHYMNSKTRKKNHIIATVLSKKSLKVIIPILAVLYIIAFVLFIIHYGFDTEAIMMIIIVIIGVILYIKVYMPYKKQKEIDNLKKQKELSMQKVFESIVLKSSFEKYPEIYKHQCDLSLVSYKDKYNLRDVILEKIENRSISGKPSNYLLDFLGDKVTQSTLIASSNFAFEKLTNYSIFEVEKSTNSDIEAGVYFYHFTEESDIRILKVPYVIIETDTKKYMVYSKNLESDVKIIKKSVLRDFVLFGNQLIETNIKATHQAEKKSNDKPKLLATMFSEYLFGTSYTLLKGLNKDYKSSFSIDSSNQVIDLRTVQLIFENKTDLLIRGVLFFMELTRHFGNIKNKHTEHIDNNEIKTQEKVQLEESIEGKIPAKLKELKTMYDNGLINDNEYQTTREKLLEQLIK